MKRPAIFRHSCCPNSTSTLIGHRTERGYNWKLRLRWPALDNTRHEVAVIYCPWCAVNLDEWVKLQLRPRLVVEP